MSGNQPVGTATASQAETQVTEWLADVVDALGGQDRPGQQRMATEVAKALESGTHLLVQAGTGTGKSLAYLIPAVDYAWGVNRRSSSPPPPWRYKTRSSNVTCRACWKH